MTKAIQYLRVSSEEQKRSGLGIAAQLDRNARLAAMLELELIHPPLVDEGVSAGVPLSKREQGAKLLELTKAGNVTVIAYNLDRLFRDVDDGRHVVMNVWQPKKVRLLLSNEGGNAIDTSTALGRAMFSFRLVVAELERGMAGERTSAALKVVKERGRHVGSAPYGYRSIVTRGDDGRKVNAGMHEKDPKEWRVVARILQLSYELKRTPTEIASYLNAGCYKTREGRQWTHVQVGRILARERRAA